MVGKGSSGNTECYAIERILGSRMNAAAQLEYLIKWKEPESEKTWESVDNLFSTKMTKIQALSNENSSEIENVEMRAGQRNDKRPRDPETQQKQRKSKRIRNDELQSTSADSIPIKGIPRQSKRIIAQKAAQHREIDRVESIRKRKNHHEYLVKWKNCDEEVWIERNIMIARYPQSVIAALQRLVVFK